jgi:hypothetical protein
MILRRISPRPQTAYLSFSNIQDHLPAPNTVTIHNMYTNVNSTVKLSYIIKLTKLNFLPHMERGLHDQI